MLAGVFAVGLELDTVTLLQGQAELEGVDGIQPQPLDEQRLVGVDVIRRDVFQFQGVDDQLLEFAFQLGGHRWVPLPMWGC